MLYKLENSDALICIMRAENLGKEAHFYHDKANNRFKLFVSAYRDFDKYVHPIELLTDYIDSYRRNGFKIINF